MDKCRVMNQCGGMERKSMNRIEFVRQLESLLQNISPSEREEALQYYNDYFNDAGPENEHDVIEALGNPAKVAENIKKDLYGSGYGDNIYRRAATGERAVVEYGSEWKNGNDSGSFGGYGGSQAVKRNLSTGTVILIVAACVLLSPAVLSVAGGILSAVFGLFVGWFAIILSFGLVAVVLLVLMIALIIGGFACMVVSPMTGIGLIGGGLVCGGFGLLFLMLTVVIAGVTPSIFRWIGKLWRKLIPKKNS